jgi:hypothetical protein
MHYIFEMAKFYENVLPLEIHEHFGSFFPTTLCQGDGDGDFFLPLDQGSFYILRDISVHCLCDMPETLP